METVKGLNFILINRRIDLYHGIHKL